VHIKYHLSGIIGGGMIAGFIGYLLKGNSGMLFGAFYGVVLGEIISVSIAIRNKNTKNKNQRL